MGYPVKGLAGRTCAQSSGTTESDPIQTVANVRFLAACLETTIAHCPDSPNGTHS
jgi:hypothetical protein